jgi:ABC-type nitrate/sulfonate/bicarbonate transport system substrate-binding protein
MSSTTSSSPLDTLWFTRCAGNGRGGVPTATGIASQLGWLKEEFAPDGIRVRALQDEDAAEFRHNHYDHELTNLIREGGNLFAIPAKAQGAKTRLIGLTWIEEGQFILVRKDSDIKSPQDLKGKRLSLPALNPKDIAENKRGRSISRYMSLQGYKGALNSVGLSLDDITLVETGGEGTGGDDERSGFFVGAQALLDGKLDGLYVKGGSAVDKARELGLVVGIDLDKLPERRFRVNNGTPRPITVHEDLLNNHFDIVVRFLAQTLRAAEWAKTNLDGVYDALHKETGASREGLEGAYRDGFHLSLAPDLSPERVELFRQQKDFLLTYGVLDRDFDYDAWIDYSALDAAQKLVSEWEQQAAAQARKVANS